MKKRYYAIAYMILFSIFCLHRILSSLLIIFINNMSVAGWKNKMILIATSGNGFFECVVK